MAKIDDALQAASDLQVALDAKQQQLTDAFAAINAKLAADAQTIADLEAIIASGNGATDAQLQSLIDSLTASRDDLAGTPTA